MDERGAKAAGQEPPSFDDPPVMSDPPAAPTRRRQGKHTASPRKAPEKPVLWPVLTVVSLVVIAALLLLVVNGLTWRDAFRRLQAEDRAETLADGITVNGARVGGYSRAQAYSMLSSHATPDALAFEYQIRVQDRTWYLTQSDLTFGSDYSGLIDQAWSASRVLAVHRGETLDSPFAARSRRREQLRANGLSITGMSGYQLSDVERFVSRLAASVDRAPVSAALISVDFSRRSFTFSEDIPGLTLNQPTLVSDIAGLLDSGVTAAEITAAVTSTPARVSRLSLMNTFGCLEIRNFETSTPGGDAPVRALIEALNGAIVPSGETVSLNGLLSGLSDRYEAANADRFATALFSAGVCAGMTLIERTPLLTADTAARGLEAHVDDNADLRLKNGAETPLCVLCYYTPHNSRGTRGAVTLEIYGILRQGGETAELATKVTQTLPAGTPEYQVNPDLEPGTTLLRREARDGARVNTLLVRKVNGRAYNTEIICSAEYPPVSRLVETGP